MIWRARTKPRLLLPLLWQLWISGHSGFLEGEDLGVQGLELGRGSSAPGCGVVQKRPSSAPSAASLQLVGRVKDSCKGSKVLGTQEA